MLVAAAGSLALIGDASAQPAFSILYYETLDEMQLVAPAAPAVPGQSKPQSTRLTSLSFTAFGRHFDLELEPNERILRELSVDGRRIADGIELYRGRSSGDRNSWLRLTRFGGKLSGLIWDDTELYAIEPAARVHALLAQKPSAPGSGTIIYRWSETTGVLRGGAPIVPPADAKAIVDDSSGSELLAALLGQAFAFQRLNIGLVADVEFASIYGLETEAELLVRANNIDGILVEQVGTQLFVAELRVFAAEQDPFSSSDSSGLLSQLADYKQADAALANQGIAHLFSGRAFAAEPDGSVIVGKAYLGTVCHARLGAGYTTTEGSAFADTLIAAHEFGHNFGAPHDAEEGSPCQSVPDTFLMAPFVNSSEQFSTCSLEQMAPVIAAATCLEDLFPSDLVLTKLFVGDDVLLGAPFTGTFAVDNTEPEDAFGVAVTFEADPGLELLAVRGTQTTQTGAECTATATGVICQSTGFDPERA